MLDDLVMVIETLRQRIRDHRGELASSETRTRMALVDPLLTALGWDTSDPALVIPEYSVSSGKADYGLLNPGPTPSAFIEAKKLDESLESHREQMTRYSNMAGVKYAGLTNGDRWELYDVFTPASLDQRRILDVSILTNPVHESALKMLLLWRPNLQSGSPVTANEPAMASGTGPVTSRTPSSHVVTQPLEPPVPPASPQGGNRVSIVSMRVSLDREHQLPAPESIAFPDGSLHMTKRWTDLLGATLHWLWSTDRLTASDLPIPLFSNSRRLIVHTTPVHRGGTPFRRAIPVGGTPLYFDGNIGSNGVKEGAITLLKHSGVDPEEVFVVETRRD